MLVLCLYSIQEHIYFELIWTLLILANYLHVLLWKWRMVVFKFTPMKWMVWIGLVILNCTKCDGIIFPAGIPCFFIYLLWFGCQIINWSPPLLLYLSTNMWWTVSCNIHCHCLRVKGAEPGQSHPFGALVSSILLLDPCLAEISKNHCICAGKYKVRASHPDLKVEVRGSAEVRYAACPFLSDLQFFPCLLLFA